MSQQQPKIGLRESTNLLYAGTQALSVTVTPFLRHSFGKEALGWPGLGAFALLLVCASFSRSEAMWAYFGLWIIALCYQRNYTKKLMQQGAVVHSRSPGYPALGVKFTKGNVKVALMVVEPLICGVLGYMLLDLGQEMLGKFLMCAAGALMFQHTTQRMIDERRVQSMVDARVEQEWLSRQLRDR